MKLDMFTAIGVAIGGVLIAFFITNLLFKEPEPYSVPIIDTSASSTADNFDYANLSEPDNEVFNYDALNPTVEVYVGECDEYDSDGNCVNHQDNNNDYNNAQDEDINNEDGDSDSGTNEQENE